MQSAYGHHAALRLFDAVIDVFPDGEFVLGTPGSAAKEALFQFPWKLMLVNCSATFSPAVGEKPPLFYMEDKARRSYGDVTLWEGRYYQVQRESPDDEVENDGDGPEMVSYFFEPVGKYRGDYSNRELLGFSSCEAYQAVPYQLLRQGYVNRWIKAA